MLVLSARLARAEEENASLAQQLGEKTKSELDLAKKIEEMDVRYTYNEQWKERMLEKHVQPKDKFSPLRSMSKESPELGPSASQNPQESSRQSTPRSTSNAGTRVETQRKAEVDKPSGRKYRKFRLS